MNQCRFSQDRKDMTDTATMKKQMVYLQTMTGLAQHLGLPKTTMTNLQDGTGLDNVTFAQARALLGPGVHTDNLPEIKGFDMAKALQFLSTNINEDMAIPLLKTNQGYTTNSQAFQEKILHFSGDFLKDFFRNGITMDGEVIKGSGTVDPDAMEQALDKLIAKFPSIDEAGQTTRGLFQATAATHFNILIEDGTTNETFMKNAESGGAKRTDSLIFNLTTKGNGQYDVAVDLVGQKAKHDDSGTTRTDPYGMSTHAEMTLTGADQTDTPPHVLVHSFDFILGTLNR